MDNSIRLKELQVVNGALRKRDKGLGFSFSFSKGFFWVRRRRWGNSTPSKRGFVLRDWDRSNLLGWGLSQRVVS